ncbi:unnamed protein product [Orchesella dallaii]|uniref:Uncharacterized protein n=1 Tax=Orchesella dallaii TaxID=48710 RepID=A0ABP1S134_9HEXA
MSHRGKRGERTLPYPPHHKYAKCCGLSGCGPHGRDCFCGVSCHGPLCTCPPDFRYFLCHPEIQYPHNQPDYTGAAGRETVKCKTIKRKVAPSLAESMRRAVYEHANANKNPLDISTLFTRVSKPFSPEEEEEFNSQLCLGDILLFKFMEAKRKALRRPDSRFPWVYDRSKWSPGKC